MLEETGADRHGAEGEAWTSNAAPNIAASATACLDRGRRCHHHSAMIASIDNHAARVMPLTRPNTIATSPTRRQ